MKRLITAAFALTASTAVAQNLTTAQADHFLELGQITAFSANTCGFEIDYSFWSGMVTIAVEAKIANGDFEQMVHDATIDQNEQDLYAVVRKSGKSAYCNHVPDTLLEMYGQDLIFKIFPYGFK